MTIANSSCQIVAMLLLGIASTGCSSHPHKAATADVKMGEKSTAQDCQRVANEASRFHNSAVSAYNSGRRDAALLLLDQSMDSWRQITNEALHCGRDTVTYANERLDQALRDRDQMNRPTR